MIRANNSSDQLQITTSSLKCKCWLFHFSLSIRIMILSSYWKMSNKIHYFRRTQMHCFMFHGTSRSGTKISSDSVVWFVYNFALSHSSVVSPQWFHYMVRHLNVIKSRLKLWKEIFNLRGKLCDVQCHFAWTTKEQKEMKRTIFSYWVKNAINYDCVCIHCAACVRKSQMQILIGFLILTICQHNVRTLSTLTH